MKEFKAVQMVFIERSKDTKRPSICCKSLAHSFKSMLSSIVGEAGRVKEVSICESKSESTLVGGTEVLLGETTGITLVGTELGFSSDVTLDSNEAYLALRVL